jgi:hypothetical protein
MPKVLQRDGHDQRAIQTRQNCGAPEASDAHFGDVGCGRLDLALFAGPVCEARQHVLGVQLVEGRNCGQREAWA